MKTINTILFALVITIGTAQNVGSACTSSSTCGSCGFCNMDNGADGNCESCSLISTCESAGFITPAGANECASVCTGSCSSNCDMTCGDSCPDAAPTTCAALQELVNTCAQSCAQCAIDVYNNMVGCTGDNAVTVYSGIDTTSTTSAASDSSACTWVQSNANTNGELHIGFVNSLDECINMVRSNSQCSDATMANVDTTNAGSYFGTCWCQFGSSMATDNDSCCQTTWIDDGCTAAASSGSGCPSCGESCDGDPTTCAELQTMANGCASSCNQCAIDVLNDRLACVGDARATASSNANVLSLATLVALAVFLF